MISKLAVAILKLSLVILVGFAPWLCRAGSSTSNVTLSGNVISACTLLGDGVNLGNVSAGRVPTASVLVQITCDSALAWVLKGPASYQPFTIGNRNDYYAVLYKNVSGTQVLTATNTVSGTGTSSVGLMVALGRAPSADPPVLSSLKKTMNIGAFSTLIPITLDF